MDTPMTFADLAIGARFKFFEHGSLLTKTGPHTYDAPQWGQLGLTAYNPLQTVIPK